MSLPDSEQKNKNTTTILVITVLSILATAGILHTLFQSSNNEVSYDVEVTASIYIHPQWNITLTANENITIPLESFQLIYKDQIATQKTFNPVFQWNKDDTVTASIKFENYIPKGSKFTMKLTFTDKSYMLIDLTAPEEDDLT